MGNTRSGRSPSGPSPAKVRPVLARAGTVNATHR
jgi:hypothetical protein